MVVLVVKDAAQELHYRTILVVRSEGFAASLRRSLRARSSSASHCAHQNLPARKLASGLANHTEKSPGKRTAQDCQPSHVKMCHNGELCTILPFERSFSVDDPWVAGLECDSSACVSYNKTLNDRLDSSLAWAVAYVSGLDHLPRSRVDIDDCPWIRRFECQMIWKGQTTLVLKARGTWAVLESTAETSPLGIKI